ncbi:MAG: hypothetical protein ACFFD4_24255 [Candidatus Odinarchaeota archaeon]
MSDAELLSTDTANQKLVNEHDTFYTSTTALRYIKQSLSGPTSGGDTLPFPHEECDLLNICCYYCLALGQGNNYNVGMYGPLPVLGTEYRALLHAAMVKDEKQQDARLAGKNYVILCFFYHERLEEIVNKCRIEITDVIEKYLAGVKELQEIENSWQVLKVLIQNHIYCTDVCVREGVIQ